MDSVIPVELAVGCNEASDLLPVRSPEVLAAYGWQRAFWTVLDEGPVEDCLALVGTRDGFDSRGRWEAHLLAADAGRELGRTEDAEALACRDGQVYVLGSHFGSKRGPLRPRRAFIARFEEAAAADLHRVPVEIVRNRFTLHRAINDALAAAGISPLEPGSEVHKRFVVETRNRGADKGKAWVSRIVDGDLPVNIEGAVFGPDGGLLLGLRFPVTSQGEPIVVELADIDQLFDPDEASLPQARRIWELGLSALTDLPGDALTGIRAMSTVASRPGAIDAVVGSIDAVGKDSVLLTDHPGGGDVLCRHVRFQLPPNGGRVEVQLVRDLAPFHNVEGLAEVDGDTYYVTDEDHRVALWHTGS